MTKTHLLHILHVIKNNLSSDQLDFLGLSYSQIARIIREATDKNLITSDDQFRLILTDEGEVELNKLQDIYKIKSPWMLPKEEDRIEKIGKFDVYLPKKNRPS